MRINYVNSDFCSHVPYIFCLIENNLMHDYLISNELPRWSNYGVVHEHGSLNMGLCACRCGSRTGG